MRNAVHLDVGPLRFALRTAEPEPVRYTDPAYGGFFCAAGGEPPLAEVPVDVVRGAVAPPAGEPLWRAGDHWAVWADGADLVFRVGLRAPASAQRSCRDARDLARAELALPATAWADGVCEAPLRYPLDQILSWGLLARLGGALLHAAVAVKDGRGRVFTGRSGAGKSTISALLRDAGWRILNDDRVVVFRRGGEWRVAGTPWHGSGRFAEAAEVPLDGIHFLGKSAECRSEDLSAAQARLALLDVAAVPWFEETWAQGILDGLDRLTREVEIARFHFPKTPQAAQALARIQPSRRAGVCA